MPRYESECQDCHFEFEERQRFSSEPVATCPECKGGARRVFHAVPIVFKGAGFYVNDYAKGKNGAVSSTDGTKDSESKEDSKAKKKSKSDSKAKAKKEPASAEK